MESEGRLTRGVRGEWWWGELWIIVTWVITWRFCRGDVRVFAKCNLFYNLVVVWILHFSHFYFIRCVFCWKFMVKILLKWTRTVRQFATWWRDLTSWWRHVRARWRHVREWWRHVRARWNNAHIVNRVWHVWSYVTDNVTWCMTGRVEWNWNKSGD